ncbi:MAG TPA: ribosome biogenesis GTPase Der, partial [Urbifossiella sp.]
LRDSVPFPEVAIKLVLRAKGEAGLPQVSGEETATESAEPGDEIPVLRKLPERKKKRVEEAPPVAKPRKKKPESETWDL